jgi:hypothetical protein
MHDRNKSLNLPPTAKMDDIANITGLVSEPLCLIFGFVAIFTD